MFRRLSGVIVTSMLAACATSPPVVNEVLDPVTGVTVTSNNTPLILYRDNPSRAAYAKNFLHIGPIQVNRSGTYRYYLWIGIWNTMHAEDLAGQRDGFESITVFADGELLALELAGWSVDSIGASQPIYTKPVAAAADAYYEVTHDQIRLIAEAERVTLRTVSSRSRTFELWDAQTSAFEDMRLFVHSSF